MNRPTRSVTQRLAPRERGFFLPLLALCFGIGVWLAPRVTVGLWPLWLVALAMLLVIPLVCFRLPVRWVCLPLALAAALLWTNTWLNPAVPVPGSYDEITATVYGEPSERTAGGVSATLCRVTLNGVEQPGRAYCTIDETAGLTADDLFDGALLRFQGKVYLPAGKLNENDFDFRMWLLQNGIGYGISGVKEPVLLNTRETAPVVSFPARVRAFCAERFQTLMGEEGNLAMAMLLGDKDGLAEDEQLAFQRAGVAHLMAVSGLHVGFLLGGLLWLLNLLTLRKSFRLPVTAAFLALYCWITGFPPAAVRAATMALLVLGADAVGRRHDPLTTLSAAAILVLAINPLQLFSAGFVLSFTAMAGIMFLYRPILTLFSRPFGAGQPRPRTKAFSLLIKARESSLGVLAVSLSAQIGVLLPTAAYFHKLPLYGMLFNLLAVPLAGILVPLYAITLLASILPVVGAPLGMALGFVAKWGSWLLLRILELSARLPYAQVRVPSPNLWACVGLLLGVLALSGYLRAGRGRRVLAAVLICYFACMGAYLARPAALRYDQLSVGQGDAALLMAGNRTIAVDVGEQGSEMAGRLLAEGRSLDAVLLTHLHADHAKGLLQLLKEEIPIGHIYLPDGALDVTLDADAPVIWDAITRSGIPVTFLSAGDTLTYPELNIQVLWPEKGKTRAGLNANERSMATMITLDSLRMLSMADNTTLYEQYIVKPCDILKVGHHGSAASTSDAFLDQADPAIAIVSCRSNARLPSADTLERLTEHGAKILRTDETGEITLSAVNGTYRITTYRTGENDEP